MASTNKTTNYELSQFLGTDKPAWLSDYNTDMSKIDAQMKLNADAATAAQGDATSAGAAVGTLANLTTDAKTSAVAAINEVDSHADSAQGTASSALSAATGAATDVAALAAYHDLSVINNYTASSFTITQGSGTVRNSSSITVARNADGTLCKIYGTIIVDNPSGATIKVKLNTNTGLSTDSKITVASTGFTENLPSTYGLGGMAIDINTDGTLEFNTGAASGMTALVMRALACIIFVKNFGDED